MARGPALDRLLWYAHSWIVRVEHQGQSPQSEAPRCYNPI